MIRFLSFIFGKPYEPCKSCETLKEQLLFERDQVTRLSNTLLSIVKHKEVEQAPVEIAPVQQSSALWTRRRAALEEKDRQEAFIIAQAKHLAKPDRMPVRPADSVHIDNIGIPQSVEQLEKELGVEEGV